MTTGTAPADTTMMGVVHDALRRDLARLQTALTAPVAPDDERRPAPAAHLDWMLDLLHRHHRGEDAGLWPLVRDRNAQAGALLDDMEADHARIAPRVETLRTASERYRSDPDARADLVEALSAFADVLLPHLRREEDEAMPVVSRTLSDAEWRAWDQKHNLRGKSLPQLAIEGHWLMDGLDPDRYDVLMGLVPPPVRVVIVRGYRRSYRRACARRWGPDVPVGPLGAAAA
jgi:hemerythrin-like domain-containing protein